MKATPLNIVCHAFPAWEGNYVKSTVELMKAVARQGHRVLYVDYAYTWTDFFKSMLGKGHASWQRMLGFQPRLRREASFQYPLNILTLPPVLPANFLKNTYLHDAVNRLNSHFIGRHIRRAASALGMDNITVINAFNPGFGLPLAGKLGEQRLLYYCYDEIGAAAWASRHGARLERAFLQKCAAVVVSSEGLRKKQEAHHAQVFLVKNGVDADLFGAEISAQQLPFIPTSHPAEKIIGYLGSVDDRLDFALLERLFRQFVDARFVFVGRLQNEAIRARLAAFPNVFLAGAHPPDDLPAWVASMDVCLIPFIKNEFTAGIYPLKINEYLAAGKPVVTTDFAPLSEFSDLVAIANTTEDFIKAITSALAESDEEVCLSDTEQEYAGPTITVVSAKTAQQKTVSERRQAFARQNSWAERAKQLVEVCRPTFSN